MKITKLKIPEVLLIEPFIFEDNRGFFFESFNLTKFQEATSLNVIFVQDNHSKSTQGIFRGLHYQLTPHAQGKLVRVIQGEVLDIAVDLRRSSPTFGESVAEILSSENKKQMWIPEGFAHGFLTLSETSEFLYKTTDYYYPLYERCLLWNDNSLNIEWPKGIEVNVSFKDKSALSFNDCETFS
jgi:dTDP-4-dehydrorhamnose 3,5-epimerase